MSYSLTRLELLKSDFGEVRPNPVILVCFLLTSLSRMSTKRKRQFSEDYYLKPKRAPFKKRKYISSRAFVPGRDRVSGYYGRFAGAGGELKFHDIAVNNFTVQSTGNIQNAGTLIVIPQGTGENQRIGRKCTLRSVHMKFKIDLPEKDAVTKPARGETVRIILYVDKQANGTTAAVLDILETTDMQSFRNLSNSQRFVTICDKLHNINYAGMASDGAGVVSQGEVTHSSTFNKKLNLPIEYSDVFGAMVEIRSNNVGILLISENGVGGFEANLRFRFSDQG